MPKNIFNPVRGMKDLYGIDINKYQYITNTALKIAKKYGYNLIETPIVESTEVFQRSIGDETDVVSKEMYTFKDKGDESITLRPEGTAGVMRAIVSNNITVSNNIPLKLMYYGPMFRYDRPQKGRYRQFHQLGFESIGAKSPYTDAINIALANEILTAVGVFDCQVYINSLGELSSRENYTKAIVKYFSIYEDKLSEESRIRLKKNPLRILDSKDKNDKEICLMAPKISDYLSKNDIKYFECVCENLSKYGIKYSIDNLLVRGLDYYSHTIFELKVSNGQYKDAIGGGGRYDRLLSILGGPDVSGIGFAIGIERLMMLLDNNRFQQKENIISVIPVSDKEIDNAFELYKTILSNDIRAEFVHIGNNLSKKVEIASKLNSTILLIIGNEEVKNNTITITYMNKKEEEGRNKVIDRNNIIGFLKYL